MHPDLPYMFCIVLMWCHADTEAQTSDYNESLAELDETGPWSSLLEDWATEYSGNRQKRIMRLGPTHGYYITNRNDPSSEEWTKMSPPKPGKVINRPPPVNGYPNQLKPSYSEPVPQVVAPPPGKKEVSETDLYLLGAIEKMVYRVDFMEKRLRKVEEMLYYVMAGSNKKPDSCPKNYTRAGSYCYYFGYTEKYDWKTANVVCKKLKGNLAEMETIEENQDVVAYIQSRSQLQGKDFWTGGLNPGLLWIWSNSARPVHTTKTNETQLVNHPLQDAPHSIHGNGRCLKLAYNPTLRSYAYYGFDCSVRQHYICELPDKGLSNDIDRLAKDIKLRENKYIPLS